MWKKFDDTKVIRRDSNVTYVYDEANLRRSLRSYLSDESRARFGGKTSPQINVSWTEFSGISMD